MELRWILILAGIGIFAFLYFSGRPKKRRPLGSVGEVSAQDPYQGQGTPGAYGGGSGQGNPGNLAGTDEHLGGDGYLPQDAAHYRNHPAVQQDHHSAPPVYTDTPYAGVADASSQNHHAGYGQTNDPLMDTAHPFDNQDNYAPGAGGVPAGMGGATNAPPHMPQAEANGPDYGNQFELDPGDMQRPADSAQRMHSQWDPVSQQNNHAAHAMAAGDTAAVADAAATGATRNVGGLSGWLTQLSGGLLGKSRDAAKAGGPAAGGQSLYAANGVEPMLISLHVVAPEGQIIHGPRLQALFEQRGYHFGEMNIFHSLNQGSIVFSVAKIVEPGTFDINDPSSFETPGVTLILQLPAPVAADVAFEVLISEAGEMASSLGCDILDGDHSTLSRQTVQHLRDSVHQFMHRQRLAESVPS